MSQPIETTVFVLSSSNTLPVTGGTHSLAPGQFGVFKKDLTPTDVGTIAGEPYIILAQGRNVDIPGQGSKKSDKIYLKNVIKWYKKSAHPSVSQQITDISNFTPRCGETVTISFRIMSEDIITAYRNGLLISYTELAPCCECGEEGDPCETLGASDIEALVDKFVDRINNDENFFGNKQFLTAERIGSGGSSVLRVHGNPLPSKKRLSDPKTYPFAQDRLYFWAYAYKGPELSIDYLTYDRCNPFASVETVQHSSYPMGSSDEARQIEKNYWANNRMPGFRRLYCDEAFNDAYGSEVVDGTWYDFYYLEFAQPVRMENVNGEPYAEAVIILNPTGQNSNTITMLTTFLGSPEDATGPQITTTTTSTTTSTTTLTTTTTTM